MKKTRPRHAPAGRRNQNPAVCTNCGCDQSDHRIGHGGNVCQSCSEKLQGGRDRSTRAARAMKVAHQARHVGQALQKAGHTSAASHFADADDMQRRAVEHASVEDQQGPMAEAALQTLDGTRCVLGRERLATDASAHRVELVSRFGNDVVAMALDAASSIGAKDALETMLTHQLARTHKAAMEIMAKAALEQDPVEQARLFNTAARMMNAYQSGLLTLHRLRHGNQQVVIVKQVNVSEGGQAVVGTVKGGSV